MKGRYGEGRGRVLECTPSAVLKCLCAWVLRCVKK